MIDNSTAIDAEAFRRRHCDNRQYEHRCVGVITIKPGICMFNCQLCGEETVDLREAMDVLDDKERRLKIDE